MMSLGGEMLLRKGANAVGPRLLSPGGIIDHVSKSNQ